MASRRCVARRHRPCARLAHSVPAAATPTVTAEDQAHPPSGPSSVVGLPPVAAPYTEGAPTRPRDAVREGPQRHESIAYDLPLSPWPAPAGLSAHGREGEQRGHASAAPTRDRPPTAPLLDACCSGTRDAAQRHGAGQRGRGRAISAARELTTHGGRWRARGAWAPSSVRCAALALGACCRETDRYGRGPRTGPSAPLHDRFAPCGSPLRAGVIQVAISCVARTLTVRLHGHLGQGPGQHTARAAHAIPPTNAPLPGSPAVR